MKTGPLDVQGLPLSRVQALCNLSRALVRHAVDWQSAKWHHAKLFLHVLDQLLPFSGGLAILGKVQSSQVTVKVFFVNSFQDFGNSLPSSVSKGPFLVPPRKLSDTPESCPTTHENPRQPRQSPPHPPLAKGLRTTHTHTSPKTRPERWVA